MEVIYIRHVKSTNGKISIRVISGGSKSDGFRAYLTTDDGVEYQLSRRGVYEVNDDYFLDFVDKSVLVFGEISRGWITVEYIKNEK